MESKCFSPTTRITRSQPGRNCARRPPCLSSFWGQRLERKGLAQNSIDIIVNVRYFVFAFHYICQKVVLVLVLSLGMSFVFPFCVYIAWNAISQGIGVEWILSKICRKFGRQSTPLQSLEPITLQCIAYHQRLDFFAHILLPETNIFSLPASKTFQRYLK